MLMEWGLKAIESSRVVGDLWLQAAARGVIWVPYEIKGHDAAAMTMALNLLRDREEITLYIDTCSGVEESFDPCWELLWRRDNGKRTVGFVNKHAVSIGLSYIAVCTHRIAHPESKFFLHGELQRKGGETTPDGDWKQDWYVANWLQRFTPRTHEEWMLSVTEDEDIWFDAHQAKEWGIIDEIRESA